MLKCLTIIRLLGSLTCFLILTANSYSQHKAMAVSASPKIDTTSINLWLKQAHELRDIHPIKADSIFRMVIKTSQEINHLEGIGIGWAGLGYLQSQRGDFKKAIGTYHHALSYLKEVNDQKRIGVCMINIGHALSYLGQTDSAGIYYLEAINQLEGTPHYRQLAAGYNNLAIVMGTLNKRNKKMEYLQKALVLGRKHNDTIILIKALCDVASMQTGADSTAKALHFVREGISLAEAKGEPRYLGEAYTHLAHVLREDKKMDSALWAAKRAIQNAFKANDNNTYIYASISLSDILNEINKQQERLVVLKGLLQRTASVNNTYFTASIYEKLADACFKLGFHKEAYQHHQQFVVYKDSLLNEKSNATISELETKYQTAKKEKDLTQKELQLQESRQYIGFSIGAAGIALLAAVLVFATYRNKKKSHKQQLQSLQQEKEIQLLQALMQGEEKERSRIAKDLHDGVAGMLAAAKMQLGSLSIKNKELVETKEFTQAVKLLDDSTQEVRMTSHNLMPEVLIRHGLDEALRRYCNNISNSSLLKVHYESLGDIKRYIDTFELSVYRIVQELLNNVVKHSKATQASVQLSVKEETLFIFIEDNGIGFQQPVQREGMGLQSLQSRIKAMNGRFEVDATGNSGVSAYIEFNTTGLGAHTSNLQLP